MSTKDQEFRQRLLATFKIEADEHINAMVSGLMELEKTGEPGKQSAIVESAFREAHSLKGAARAVNLQEVEARCQALESRFSSLKAGEVHLSSAVLDEFHHVLDDLASLLRPSIETTQQEQPTPQATAPPPAIPEPMPDAGETTEAWGTVAVTPGSVEAVKETAGEGTLRISAAKLDSLFLQAEELLASKLAARRRVTDMKETAAALGAWQRKLAEITSDIRRMEHLCRNDRAENRWGRDRKHVERILQHLEGEETTLKSLQGDFAVQLRATNQDARFLAARVEGLVEEMKHALMMPFSTILDLFPKLVRDLSRQQNKEVEFVMEGGEVEVDKRILQEMKDPLTHLLRNAIDHGIESPAARAAAHKPPMGHVKLVITPRDAARIEIRVEDDGAGVQLERVLGAAVKQGFLSGAEADRLEAKAILPLVFRSGLSTNPILTDLSGRGLGLAIVQEKVDKLGGTLSAETNPHAGTIFRMVLPVTLATSRGILVRAGGQTFILPTSGVERVASAVLQDVKTVEGRDTIEIGGKALAFVGLETVLELPSRRAPANDGSKRPLVVLNWAGQRVAVGVEEVLGEQEVLVKKPAEPFAQVRYLAGATVLGTGEAVPILAVREVVEAAAKAGAGTARQTASTPGPEKRNSILVAEDSITARSLLKGILESAGYRVRTAVDGADAFTTLKTEAFDLVVSDVEMPRLNGFGLTAKIRADKELTEIPVVLVTALESREDRERGIDVGADAYLVKSSFDQSNLLEIIKRLI